MTGVTTRGQSLLSTQSEFVNQNYPTADPQSRLLNRGARRWNASHRTADAASSFVSASNLLRQGFGVSGYQVVAASITISEFLRLEVARSRLARFAFL